MTALRDMSNAERRARIYRPTRLRYRVFDARWQWHFHKLQQEEQRRRQAEIEKRRRIEMRIKKLADLITRAFGSSGLLSSEILMMDHGWRMERFRRAGIISKQLGSYSRYEWSAALDVFDRRQREHNPPQQLP